MLIIITLISYAWASSIYDMQKEHPDYKGEDFLDWDDNKQHTENV